MYGHARSQRGFDWFDQTPLPRPAPEVLFLSLHACHCMWNPSFYTFDIAKLIAALYSVVLFSNMWHSVEEFIGMFREFREFKEELPKIAGICKSCLLWKFVKIRKKYVKIKIRNVTFLNISVHNIRQATQAYNIIQTDGRTDLNFKQGSENRTGPVSHSVKFSWFLSEFIIVENLKLE